MPVVSPEIGHLCLERTLGQGASLMQINAEQIRAGEPEPHF
jgi:hypothetical protein